MVVPDENTDYRENITSPVLGAIFPDAATVEQITRAAMSDPDRDFAIVSPPSIGEAVRARCGEAVRQWSDYHNKRYGW